MDFYGRLERDFMREVQVTAPESNEPALSPIDTDDEPPLDPFD
jgi:hypothetical protein